MRAVVLVGGEGTRLRPLTYKTPKGLLPIVNVAFLERQLAWLGSHGVDDVVLSLGYLPEAFREHFSTGGRDEGRFGDMTLRFREEPEPLGTAGGIRFAAEGIDERIIVCNGDVLTDLDLGAVLEFHEARHAEATIALTEVEDPSAFGVVPTRGDGEVVAFVEKPPPGRAPTNWINAGTYVLEPSVLGRIPSRLMVSIERETFPRMLDRPGRLFGFPSDAYWLDIGTPEKYLQANADVLAGRLGRPPVADAVETAPGVWVEGDVEIAADARLVAPVLLGAGCRVGAGASVKGSVVGRGVSVGAGAHLTDAVVLAGAAVQAGARIERAVAGPDGPLGVSP
ncbi:MAG TPA: NDP-sugar synthase [Acidimicrobiia bacterium]|nr:NDP-sugar synthase [Acidimicrobiia bacterium]